MTAALAFLLPSTLARPLLNLLGHRIAAGSRIGFSLVFCPLIALDSHAAIGHFNLIRVRRLVLRKRAYVGHINVLNGPLNIILQPRAAIGNRNRVLRGPAGVTAG